LTDQFHEKSLLDISVLGVLCTRCPALQEIGLYMSSTLGLGDAQCLINTEEQFIAVTKLIIGRSRINSAADTAHYLQHMFPNLLKLDTTTMDKGTRIYFTQWNFLQDRAEDCHKWKTVHKILSGEEKLPEIRYHSFLGSTIVARVSVSELISD
jgi:hypothetical protein